MGLTYCDLVMLYGVNLFISKIQRYSWIIKQFYKITELSICIIILKITENLFKFPPN